MDIQSYMVGVGRQARAAARRVGAAQALEGVAVARQHARRAFARQRRAVREARRRVPAPAPLHLVGFSNGGALAVKYSLDAIEDPQLPRADRLVLLTPMIGITRFARFAGLAGLPALLPRVRSGDPGNVEAQAARRYWRALFGEAFRRDPDYPLLLSLEHYDEESDTARKAALFTRRTLTRVVEPSTAGEPAEALAASIQWRGRVDPAYMAGLLAAPEAEVLTALAGPATSVCFSCIR